ncbi:MAG TPA: ABC transporter ATP-binding protein [Thermoanaerobaculia bacterium]|nr:ABC transporter ATP-binding protein [Thermoanaerobaculia bacterium]
MSLIELDAVDFHYRDGVSAVRGLSSRFDEGELVAIIGPNGAGKSTLLKLIARVIAPQGGEIRFRGIRIGEIAPRAYAREVGYLPQEQESVFPMRALEVVASGRAPFLRRFQWESEGDYELARRALADCDALHLADRYLDEMSGGERKRIFLARVLCGDPKLILLDEPLTALDVSHTQTFISLIRRIVDQTGKAVLFVSHDLNWSAAYADRMMVMNAGSVVLDAGPAEVMQPEVMKRHFGFDALAVRSDGEGGVAWIVPDAGRHKPR